MRAPDINDGADEEEREREGHTCADCRTANEIEAEARAVAEAAEVREAQERLDKARDEFRTYHYPVAPPDRLIRELADAENDLARLRGGA